MNVGENLHALRRGDSVCWCLMSDGIKPISWWKEHYLMSHTHWKHFSLCLSLRCSSLPAVGVGDISERMNRKVVCSVRVDPGLGDLYRSSCSNFKTGTWVETSEHDVQLNLPVASNNQTECKMGYYNKPLYTLITPSKSAVFIRR